MDDKPYQYRSIITPATLTQEELIFFRERFKRLVAGMRQALRTGYDDKGNALGERRREIFCRNIPLIEDARDRVELEHLHREAQLSKNYDLRHYLTQPH